MKTYHLVGKTLRHFLYITEGKGGFLITLPGRTDAIGRVITRNKDTKDQPTNKACSISIGDININIELLLIEEKEDGIYLKPAHDPAHVCFIANLAHCRGGLNIFNHRGKNIYLKKDCGVTRTDPVIVRINRAILPPETFRDSSIKNILQIKSANFYVDYHHGRECFNIYFPYNPTIIEHIKRKIPERHYAFDFEELCWKIDQRCAYDVLKLLELIDQSADANNTSISH